MATDARLLVSFRTHPKRIKLQRRLGAEGVLAFIDLILFCCESRTSGDFARMTDEDVAIAAGWKGDPEELVSALIEVGFLDRADGGYLRMHDWSIHNPFAAGSKERSLMASANAHAGWLKRLGIDCAKKTCSLCRVYKSAKAKVKNGNALLPLQIEEEKEKLQKEKPASPPRQKKTGTRIPEPFGLTAKMREWAGRECPSVDLERHLPAFCDYWRGVPGARGVKCDWEGTWRNDVRRCADMGKWPVKAAQRGRGAVV